MPIDSGSNWTWLKAESQKIKLYCMITFFSSKVFTVNNLSFLLMKL
jgi:hypothetical protein